MNPFKKAKETLKNVTGALPLDVSSVVTNLLKNAENSREREYDLLTTFKKIDGDEKEISSILENTLSEDPTEFDNRKTRYHEYRAAMKKLPILKKIIRQYVGNILSPDDITKESYRIDSKKNYKIIDDEKFSSLINEYNSYINLFKIDDNMPNVIFKTCMYGDYFAEIINNEEALAQTAIEHGTPLNEINFDILEKDTCIFDENNVKVYFESPIKTNKEHSVINEDVYLQLLKNKKVDSISGLNLKFYDPWEIIILEYKNIRYGYLHIKSNDPTNVTWGDDSQKNSLSSSYKLASTVSEELEKRLGKIAQMDSFSSKFKNLISNLIDNASKNTVIRYIPCSNMQHFKDDYSGIYAPYGEGEIDDLLFRAKLLLSEDISNTTYLLSKAGGRTKIGVKAPTLSQAMNKIQHVKNAFSKRKVTIDSLGSIDTIPSIVSTFENVYVPIVNGEEQITIDNVDIGGPMSDRRDNSMYGIKQLLTGADVPPPHLGYEEWVNSKATLSSENVVFARTIIRFQKLFSKLFTELLNKIYLTIHGNSNNFNGEYVGLELQFSPPKSIMLEIASQNYTQLQTIITSLSELDISKERIIEYYFPELLSFEEKIKNKLEKSKEADSENPEDIADMGMGSFEPMGDSEIDASEE